MRVSENPEPYDPSPSHRTTHITAANGDTTQPQAAAPCVEPPPIPPLRSLSIAARCCKRPALRRCSV